MSEPIKKGDLVWIAGACCEGRRKIAGGLIFEVQSLELVLGAVCRGCGAVHSGVLAETPKTLPIKKIPVVFLRKIPPLGELEGQTDKRDILRSKEREPIDNNPITLENS